MLLFPLVHGLPDCIAVSFSESNHRILNNPLTLLGYVLQHGLALIEDFAIGKSNDGVTQFVQIRRAGSIVFDLLGVGIAIDFDAQFGFVAIEVNDEATACPAVSGIDVPVAP